MQVREDPGPGDDVRERPVPEADRGVPGGALRHAADRGQPILPDEGAQPLGRRQVSR